MIILSCTCNEGILSMLIDITQILAFVASLVGLFLVWKQLKLYNNEVRISNDIAKGTFHLELRNMFSEERRWEVHENIMTGTPNDINKLRDYLGVFEICYTMLLNGTLDEDLFRQSYYYRLSAIEHNEQCNNEINMNVNFYTKLINLGNMYGINYVNPIP